MRERFLWCVCCVALGLCACGGGGAQAPQGEPEAEQDDSDQEEIEEYSGPTWHADVAPILEEHCTGCHVEGGIGPYALTGYEQSYAVREAIKASVMDGSMPPWGADGDCNSYLGDLSMSAQEIETLVAWVDAGAPQGEASGAAPREQAPVAEPPLPRVDLTLSMPEPYEPVQSPDDYRCFVVDWPYEEEKFVTGFHVRPGNIQTAHHVIGFLIGPDQVSEFEELDAAEPGPGYTCFGGPGGEDDLATRWVGAWAPGTNSGAFPEGTGIRVAPGSKIVMQMHYNTLNGEGTDQTSLDFMVTDEVEKEAVLMPFANPAWVLGGAMPIAAGDQDASHEYVADVTDFIPFLSDGRLQGERFRIYSAALHMHSVGLRGTMGVWKGGSAQEQTCLLDVPRWDFDWQRTYRLQEPVLFEKGDGLWLRCIWDNSQENQPSGMVDTDGDGAPDTYQQLDTRARNWGDGTTDEMCLGIFYVTEE